MRRFRIESMMVAATPRSAVASVPGAAPSAPPPQGGPVAAVSPERAMEAADLALALHAMQEAIATTKREVADLERSPSGAPGMQRAACELDAVSRATEQATTTILGAVEEIEMAANLVRSAGADPGRTDQAGAILDRVLVLYEACNFQDLTGQRIRKVVTTLKYVEARLNALIAVWGNQPGIGPAPAQSSGPSSLAGPALPGESGHVSQSDVDAFFA